MGNRALLQTSNWQQVSVGVHQDVEQGEQREWHKCEIHVRSQDQQENTQQEVLEVVILKHNLDIGVLLEQLVVQDTKTADNTKQCPKVPELVQALEKFQVGEGVKCDIDQGENMTGEPSKLQGLDVFNQCLPVFSF